MHLSFLHDLNFLMLTLIVISNVNTIQWNLCIMDTLGPTKSVQIIFYQGVLIFQVSLYDKAPFGTITKCVDYAGVLIFKCPD